jgi:phage-related protein
VEGSGRTRRQWRFYRTASGQEPVREFLWDRHLPDEDAAAIAAVMTEVRNAGRAHPDVNHLRGDIWQLEIRGRSAIYRLLFAEEGRYQQVLLALEVVNQKWQKAKGRHIELAEKRLADWRERGTRRTPSRSTTAPLPK